MRNKKRESVAKDGFLFLGNQLALDFLNTRPEQNGRARELLSDFSALLRWFQAARLLNAHERMRLQQRWGKSRRAAKTLDAIRGIRERLRKAVFAWERGRPVPQALLKELNRLMAAHPMLARLEAGQHWRVGLWFKAQEPEDLIAPLADSAAKLFAEVDRKRVRKCESCVGHFHDTSKKGSRRWCSMKLCGNRVKVAAYAARKRDRAIG